MVTSPLVLVVATAACWATGAHADLVRFTYASIGSGSLGGTPFTDAAFHLTAIGDTNNRDTVVPNVIYTIEHSIASIEIEGFGSVEFTGATRTFVNNAASTVGFSRSGPDTSDLLHGPIDSAFDTWNMLTSIGPVIGNGRLLYWDFPRVMTTGGMLEFDTDFNVPATFTASIPAPGSVAVCAVVGLVTVRRQRQ